MSKSHRADLSRQSLVLAAFHDTRLHMQDGSQGYILSISMPSNRLQSTGRSPRSSDLFQPSVHDPLSIICHGFSTCTILIASYRWWPLSRTSPVPLLQEHINSSVLWALSFSFVGLHRRPLCCSTWPLIQRQLLMQVFCFHVAVPVS